MSRSQCQWPDPDNTRRPVTRSAGVRASRAECCLVPTRATVHRALLRNGVVIAQEQTPPPQVRALAAGDADPLVANGLGRGVFLIDGRECKMLSGIDDHSRFAVIATVLAVPNGRAVCDAFAAAMRRYGVPSEVLTDNGKQCTGRFTSPRPAEVHFERVCPQTGLVRTRRHRPRIDHVVDECRTMLGLLVVFVTEFPTVKREAQCDQANVVCARGAGDLE